MCVFFFHSCFKKRKILSLSLTKGREGGTTQFPEITPSRLKNEKQHQHIEPYYMHCYTRAKFLQILSSFPWVTEERQQGLKDLAKHSGVKQCLYSEHAWWPTTSQASYTAHIAMEPTSIFIDGLSGNFQATNITIVLQTEN